MAARSLGLAATLGLAVNAILLPPDVSIDSVKVDAAWTLIDPTSQPLLVPCGGCEMNTAEGPRNLLLDISAGSQPGTLDIGGKPFFPPSAFVQSDPSSQPTGRTVPTDKSLSDVLAESEKYTEVPIDGLTVAVRKADTVSEQGEELLELLVGISGVNAHAVDVPNVKIDVVKDSDGSLTILATSWVPNLDDLPHPIAEVEGKPPCQTSVCAWRQFIEDKMHGLSAAAHKQFGGKGRPCPGKMRGMLKDGKMSYGVVFTNMHQGPGSHHHRPLGAIIRPHHHHGPTKTDYPPRPHGLPAFARGIGRFVYAVAIPILIGVAAGFVTYAVGMIIGCAIALIWIKVFRGGKRGYASVALSEDGVAAKELSAEAESRESFESAPPVYENAPAYEEKQVV